MPHRFLLLILILVEEEIFFCRIVGPYLLDALVDIAFVFYLLQVLEHLQRCT